MIKKEEVKGLVTFQAKDSCKLLLPNHQEVMGFVSGKFRNSVQQLSDYPVVGDYVLGRMVDDTHVQIEAIQPRSSFLQRKIAGNRQVQQGIAANVATVFITTSANEEFNLQRLERFSTIVWDSGAFPVIVLNKIDTAAPEKVAELEALLTSFFAGIPVLTTSMYHDNHTLFAPYLPAGQLVTFIGSSGVGKSSLLNQLMDNTIQKTGETRQEDGRGRHTTTSRQLFVLPNGAMIIDTPGMREVGISTVQASAFDHQYQKLFDLANQCRFRNCRHNSEPGCEVNAALESGELEAAILKSYRKMEAQIEYLRKKEAREERGKQQKRR